MVGSGGDDLWCSMFCLYYSSRRAFLTTSSTFRVWGDARSNGPLASRLNWITVVRSTQESFLALVELIAFVDGS
jgi:hypothetical protein